MKNIDKELIDTINYFGLNNQIRKLNEEHDEVIDAISELIYFNKYKPDGINNMFINNVKYKPEEYVRRLKDHIAEEIADNLNVLRQIQLYYNIKDEDVEAYREYKSKRTIDLIEKEN